MERKPHAAAININCSAINILMALSKKHSRRITVNSEVFRWAVAVSDSDVDDWYLLDVVAQHEASNGCKLYASGIPTKGDYWFDVSCQIPVDPKD
ncbi:MAG: hypothetical protein AAF585_08920, partial [Verrucomicrobiota bacterium]